LLDPLELGKRLCEAPVEVVIFATDVSDEEDPESTNSYELAYSSHETPPDVLAQALLASAAISALVLPLTVGDRIATDGGWVRNFPLGAALDHPDVNLVVAFRYVPRYPHIGSASLARVRRRLNRFRAVPPVRAFIAELDEAEARELRGEPVHLGDMLIRLMRVAIQRNTALEERLADERDAAIRELDALRSDVTRIVAEHARPGRRNRAARAVEDRFARTELPRLVPRITVRGTGGAESLDAGFRSHREWSEEAKRALIARGYAAADAELATHGIDLMERAV
jgi:predicted acylesterase/phospholipase RssA